MLLQLLVIYHLKGRGRTCISNLSYASYIYSRHCRV